MFMFIHSLNTFTSCTQNLFFQSSQLSNDNPVLLVAWTKNLVVTLSLSYTPQQIDREILLALPLNHEQNPLISH